MSLAAAGYCWASERSWFRSLSSAGVTGWTSAAACVLVVASVQVWAWATRALSAALAGPMSARYVWPACALLMDVGADEVELVTACSELLTAGAELLALPLVPQPATATATRTARTTTFFMPFLLM